jgi:hypothetical protein
MSSISTLAAAGEAVSKGATGSDVSSWPVLVVGGGGAEMAADGVQWVGARMALSCSLVAAGEAATEGATGSGASFGVEFSTAILFLFLSVPALYA